eukprot:74954-Pelagomonas_calceolata.AAC.1
MDAFQNGAIMKIHESFASILDGTLASLVMKFERSLLKSAPGACKFKSVLDRMMMKLQRKLDGCMSVKTKLFKGLQSVTEVAVLLLGGPLFWKELNRCRTLEAGGMAVAGAGCSLFTPDPTSQWMPGISYCRSFDWNN